MNAPIAGTRVRLYFRCEKLKDMDTFSKSDPYVVLYHTGAGARPGAAAAHHGSSAPLTVAGRTETKKDDLSPQFEQSVEVDYYFETKQEFAVKVFDEDGKGDAGNDLLGHATFQLSHVVGSRGGTLKVDLRPGTLFVTAKEESQAGRDTVVLKFRGKDMKKMDFFGTSDPFFKLERLLPNGTTKLLFESKVISNNLNPDWMPLPRLRIADLATADPHEKTLRFHCFDKDMFSSDDMGRFECSFSDLVNAHRDGQPFVLAKPEKPGKRYGDIYVEGCDITHYPSFLDFLRGGLQINLAVSIDFTGSNGDPRNPRSLHYMDPVAPNQYVRAIMSVGDILMEYDTDKMVPAFGFGAQLPNGETSHFFHLNFQQDPNVHGVQGILDSYGAALTNVRLAGPTNFAPTIQSVNHVARSQPNTYTVLLIITDGEITDMDRTIDAIVGCDDGPMSIIIVGVGNGCDFAMMDQLDGDGQRLRSTRGQQMHRDIVQFVPFRNYVNAPPGALAAEVLREVPGQLVDWAIATGRKQ
jgi:hypothetical protein